MPDTQTELSEIRARVDAVAGDESLSGNAMKLYSYSRRLLELLDERDAEIERQQRMLVQYMDVTGKLSSDNSTLEWQRDTLRRELAEAREAISDLINTSDTILQRAGESFRMEYARGTVMQDYRKAVSRGRRI